VARGRRLPRCGCRAERRLFLVLALLAPLCAAWPSAVATPGTTTVYFVSAAESESGLARAATTCGLIFSAATPVLLASGKTKPISKLTAGDKVLATDAKTGEDRAQTVQAVLINHDTDLLDLVVLNSRGRRALAHTTAYAPEVVEKFAYVRGVALLNPGFLELRGLR
jgi:hypothetical protein